MNLRRMFRAVMPSETKHKHTTVVTDTGAIGSEDRFDGLPGAPEHDPAALGDTLQHSVVSSEPGTTP